MRSKFIWLLALAAVAASATSVAAGDAARGLITGADIKPHSITSRQLADHTIQARNLSAALIASLRRPMGAQAEPAQNAVSAYAFVVPGEVSLNVDPVLVAGRSRNIVGVSSPSAGVFCLKPSAQINAQTRAWSVTPELSRSTVPSNVLFAYADTAGGTCPSGEFGVRTYRLLAGVAQPSEDVAFMVVVP